MLSKRTVYRRKCELAYIVRSTREIIPRSLYNTLNFIRIESFRTCVYSLNANQAATRTRFLAERFIIIQNKQTKKKKLTAIKMVKCLRVIAIQCDVRLNIHKF